MSKWIQSALILVRNIIHARELGKRTAGDILVESLYTLDFGFIEQRSIVISGRVLLTLYVTGVIRWPLIRPYPYSMDLYRSCKKGEQ